MGGDSDRAVRPGAQEEVVHLTKCLAWCELQQLRAEVAAKRQTIEETAPQQHEQVASASQGQWPCCGVLVVSQGPWGMAYSSVT